MVEYTGATYALVSRYRDENGDLQVRCTYGPFNTKEEAEAENIRMDFVDPDQNLIIRNWSARDIEREEADAAFLERITQIGSRVKMGMKCFLKIGRDEENPTNGRFYFQIKCWRIDVITQVWDWGYGGKAYLGRHMTDSELFQIIFGLYKGYWEHEARENFEIDGLRPFGPHISTEALLTVAKKVDVRSARHIEDQVLSPEFVSEILDRAEIEAIENSLDEYQRAVIEDALDH